MQSRKGAEIIQKVLIIRNKERCLLVTVYCIFFFILTTSKQQFVNLIDKISSAKCIWYSSFHFEGIPSKLMSFPQFKAGIPESKKKDILPKNVPITKIIKKVPILK